MKRKKKNQTHKITVEDYIKAVKKADREIQLSQQAGWQGTTNVHKSKKTYDRKQNKNFLKDQE